MDNFMDRLMARFNSADSFKTTNNVEKENDFTAFTTTESSPVVSHNNDEVLAEIKKLSEKNDMLAASLKAVSDRNAILMEAVRSLTEKNNAIVSALAITNEKNAILMEALVEINKKQNAMSAEISMNNSKNSEALKAMSAEINTSSSKNEEVMKAISGMIEDFSAADDQSDNIANDFSAMQQDIANSNRSIKKIINDNATIFATVNKIQSKLAESQEKTDKATAETQAKIGATLAETQSKITESLSENQAKLDKSMTDTQEFMHKESVKVYRNVQAMVEEENSKLLTNIGEKLNEDKPVKWRGGLGFGLLLGFNTVVAVVNLVLLLNEYVRILPF